MLFTSYAFIAFIAVAFFLYYRIPRKWQWPFLLIISIGFLCIGRNFLSHLFTCKFGGDLSGRTVDRKRPKTGERLHPGKWR